MAAFHIQPETLEERLVYRAIVGTWLVWAIGGLYILAPVLGWSLIAICGTRWLSPPSNDRPVPVVTGCLVWIAAMSVMAVGLIIGHIDFGLGFGATLKSFIGWMKGWALMAVFMLVGASMKIRASVIYRASGHLAAQTLVLAPLFVMAALVHLPGKLYVSPLQIVGGPGPEFFTVELYGIEPETGGPRWRFFAPWAPAAAMIANISFVFALFERNRLWQAIGFASTAVVCVLCQSRLGIIALPIIAFAIYACSNLTRPHVYAVGAVACVLMILFADQLVNLVDDLMTRFTNARASSSRVRAVLQSIALHRWWNEAPVWGHGIVERGPHLVEYMPIGSHQTWNGLLYVKGAVGFLALAVPMSFSFLETILKAQSDRIARAALGVLVVLGLYSFGENLEILVYLFWPGVIIVGIAARHRIVNPFRAFMRGRGRAESMTLTNA